MVHNGSGQIGCFGWASPTRHRDVSALAAAAAQANAMQVPGAPPQRMPVGAPPPGMELPQTSAPAVPIRKDEPKVGRNDPCPCGSGRKYKKCCGAE